MQKFVSFIFVVIIGGIFVSFSSLLDQKIAYLPFNPLLNKFYGETSFWCDFIYHLVPVLTTLMIVVPLVILIFYKKTSVIAKRAAIIWLVALALGPGLIVNSLLKNHWGRARPYQVLRDHKTFSPVWQYQSNAPLNNSFCSGHAAIGFFLWNTVFSI
jgi:membrane-associated PAP2 superfamily phosphatase